MYMCIYLISMYSFLGFPESHSWSRRETSGSAPRAQSLSVILSDTQLVTFGGVLKGKAVNDIHLLDTGEGVWSTSWILV